MCTIAFPSVTACIHQHSAPPASSPGPRSVRGSCPAQSSTHPQFHSLLDKLIGQYFFWVKNHIILFYFMIAISHHRSACSCCIPLKLRNHNYITVTLPLDSHLHLISSDWLVWGKLATKFKISPKFLV